MVITDNTRFSQWGKVFVAPAMTLAAVDPLVHHSNILEMNVDGYHRRAAPLLHNANCMYPALNGTGATFWMGDRPSTPDSLPVIERPSRAGNVLYAFGHGHSGLRATLIRPLAPDAETAGDLAILEMFFTSPRARLPQ